MGDVAGWDVDGIPRDVFSRVIPHRLGFLSYIKAVPGLADQFIEIPPQFWNDDVEDGVRVGIIACPCKETPVVPLNELRVCGCQRVYAFIGRSVRVANRPGQYSEQPVPVADL